MGITINNEDDVAFMPKLRPSPALPYLPQVWPVIVWDCFLPDYMTVVMPKVNTDILAALHYEQH